MIRRLCLSVFALALCPSLCNAQVFEQSIQFLLPAQSVPQVDVLTVPAADPNLGPLHRVRVMAETSIVGRVAYENLAPTAAQLQLQIALKSMLSSTDGTIILAEINPTVLVEASAAPFDGIDDQAGPSGGVEEGFQFGGCSIREFEAGDERFEIFQNGATVDLMVSLLDLSSVTGSVSADFDQTATCELTFEYFYAADCNENGVPDPLDLSAQSSPDTNRNQIPDECEGTGLAYCFGNGGVTARCTPCPCGNEAPALTLGGCLNSSNTSARLRASGLSSAALDSVRFELQGANPNSFALLFAADAALPTTPSSPCFGLDSGVISPNLDGLRCVALNPRRLGAKTTDANGDVGSMTPGWGPPDDPAPGLLTRAGYTSGQTLHFQVFYRDDVMQLCGTGQGSSNAVRMRVGP
ncbi:MAG: choice-of-anchor E domain-containing protein [Planctomycetota bacterium]